MPPEIQAIVDKEAQVGFKQRSVAHHGGIVCDGGRGLCDNLRPHTDGSRAAAIGVGGHDGNSIPAVQHPIA